MIELKKPNDLLRRQRLLRGWSLGRLAEEIQKRGGGADSKLVGKWERGEIRPRPYHQEMLVEIYGITADLLGFVEAHEEGVREGLESTSKIALPQSTNLLVSRSDGIRVLQQNGIRKIVEERDWASWFGLKLAQILRMISLWNGPLFCEEIQTIVDQEIKMIDETLDQYQAAEEQAISRRQALVTIAALPLALLSWSSGALDDAAKQEFLAQCSASTTACWHLLRGNGLAAVSDIIPQFTPPLRTMALYPSKYQRTAARLAAQASILQAILAMHRLNFAAREAHCKEAVRYGTISGENNLQAAALTYLGYTYSFCYVPHLPEKGIQTFLEALRVVGDDAPLLLSNISMGLAEAYAQSGEEQQARHYIDLAQTHFPTHPELDPSFIFGDCSLHVLYQWEGKMYLELSEHYTDRGYQQKAANALLQGIGVQSISARSTAETIIYQADAARVLEELDPYITALTEAAHLAIDLGSQKRYSEALLVFQKTPEKWLREQRIQRLANDVFGQLRGRK